MKLSDREQYFLYQRDQLRLSILRRLNDKQITLLNQSGRNNLSPKAIAGITENRVVLRLAEELEILDHRLAHPHLRLI